MPIKRPSKALNNNNDIVVQNNDKGVVVGILKKYDYQRKMLDHLYNSGSFRNLNKNLLKNISKIVPTTIKSSSTVRSHSKKLIDNNPLAPKIYGHQMIHKEGSPLCPIVNTIGGPNYLLAKFLANNLKPIIGQTQPFIKYLYSFFNELKGIRLDLGYIW